LSEQGRVFVTPLAVELRREVVSMALPMARSGLLTPGPSPSPAERGGEGGNEVQIQSVMLLPPPPHERWGGGRGVRSPDRAMGKAR
jgi:hypothetical protein